MNCFANKEIPEIEKIKEFFITQTEIDQQKLLN